MNPSVQPGMQKSAGRDCPFRSLKHLNKAPGFGRRRAEKWQLYEMGKRREDFGFKPH